MRYCINHNLDYKTTAKIYEVSYANIHNWVKKAEAIEKRQSIEQVNMKLNMKQSKKSVKKKRFNTKYHYNVTSIRC